MKLSALLVATCLLGLASAQDLTSCGALNVGAEENPFSGMALSVCQTDNDQCCTQDYLDRVKVQLGQNLLGGLRDQLSDREDELEDILERFSDFLEGSFLEEVKANIPGASFLSNLGDITTNLEQLLNRANFAIGDANPDSDLVDIFRAIIQGVEEAIRDSSFLNEAQQECLVGQLNQHIQESGLLTLGQSLEQIRKSFSALNRIARFLDGFQTDLGGFVVDNFPASCVDRFIELSFCGRCTGRIPPMCSNTCGALVRACFAGFYSNLEDDFARLWNVVLQLVGTIEEEVVTLFQTENDLLDINILEIATECRVFSIGRKKRQTTDEAVVPEAIRDRAEALLGVFIYGTLGPEFCSLDSDEVEFCEGDRTSDGDRSCSDNEICTSTCQCWDGTDMRTTNTLEFAGVRANEQADNPVLSLSEEAYKVVTDTKSSAISDFLSSDEFVEVMPEGITIPSDGSVPLIVSMVTILGTVLFALLV